MPRTRGILLTAAALLTISLSGAVGSAHGAQKRINAKCSFDAESVVLAFLGIKAGKTQAEIVPKIKANAKKYPTVLAEFSSEQKVNDAFTKSAGIKRKDAFAEYLERYKWDDAEEAVALEKSGTRVRAEDLRQFTYTRCVASERESAPTPK